MKQKLDNSKMQDVIDTNIKRKLHQLIIHT